VLSALADTSIVAEGLNLSAVGGNECACRILRRGDSVCASSMPTERSEQPNDTSRPFGLTSNTVMGLPATSRLLANFHVREGSSDLPSTFSSRTSCFSSFSAISATDGSNLAMNALRALRRVSRRGGRGEFNAARMAGCSGESGAKRAARKRRGASSPLGAAIV
jgi:hypothetical protein